MKEHSPLEKLSHMFKLLGDPTKMKIVNSLIHNDLCVNDITKRLDMTPSAISHQLRILKDAQIVKSSKKGRVVTYSLSDDHVQTIVAIGLEHMSHE
ncbi:MAG TPA: metalloregulator ArsR/SmtB family transcription factor [Bacilli bacterium]|nr:metalloregulator ArsR/SmtB family transcription factor [Bacilli bacterium]